MHILHEMVSGQDVGKDHARVPYTTPLHRCNSVKQRRAMHSSLPLASLQCDKRTIEQAGASDARIGGDERATNAESGQMLCKARCSAQLAHESLGRREGPMPNH